MDVVRDEQGEILFPDLKGQAPLRRVLSSRPTQSPSLFPDLKGQAPLRRPRRSRGEGETSRFFLTSKVRLHCDGLLQCRAEQLDGAFSRPQRSGSIATRNHTVNPSSTATAFPDLKGQAPLRLSTVPEVRWFAYLFLTSKVRLHCDSANGLAQLLDTILFLTSKVRLHCDMLATQHIGGGHWLFLTSKVRLHCDNDLVNKISGPLKASFPDLKGQAPLRLIFVEKM